MDKQIEWCIEQHRKTNHFYDKYLPYEFHLRMVAQVAEDFKNLYDGDFGVIRVATFGYDLIEDCRVSYNDVFSMLGVSAANIIYAVTNEKGKNRKERGNDKYYEGIRASKGAVFVKLCDRIANVQYSKLTKSKMFEMYKKENKDFVSKLYIKEYALIFDYLDGLFA